MTATTSIANTDREYDAFLQRVQDRLTASVADGAPLFTTDVPPNLYALFLLGLPESERQYHNCHACCRFVNTYGGLVTIDADGKAHSALWHLDDTPDHYRASIVLMLHTIQNARVTGVFYSAQSQWGTPVTGPWHHFAARLPGACVFDRLTQTAQQAMAAKREDHNTLCRALADFSPQVLRTAVQLLKTEVLYRSEKVLGVAEWLLALHTQRAATKGNQRDNMTWRAVALAPAGFCHPRSSMIGTLLDDIANGLSYDTISSRFAAKMHPLQYQRPQAAPTAGNIQAAEKVVAQLQAAGALARRYAYVEEIEAIWRPAAAPPAPPQDSVFGHLAPKGRAQAMPHVQAPPITMTWEKFRRTVLPTAREITYFVRSGHDNYCALLTAVDFAAPLIFQWNHPASWYVYPGGSPSTQWNLAAGTWCDVTAVTLQPSMWGESRATHHGASAIFVLTGARDMHGDQIGNGLFPEILRSDFHPIRATIEAYSRNAQLANVEGATACGVRLQKGSTWQARFRVVAQDGMVTEYTLDRWD